MNANRGTDQGREMLKTSVEELGVGRGVVVDRDNVLIAGNKTIEAARAAGKTKIKIVETDGDTIVVTKRNDLRLGDKDDFRARALALADNRIPTFSQDIDLSMVDLHIQELSIPPELVGYSASDFTHLHQVVNSALQPNLSETPISTLAQEQDEGPEEDEEEEPGPVRETSGLQRVFQIVVDCDDENHQRKVFNELQAKGMRVKPQTL